MAVLKSKKLIYEIGSLFFRITGATRTDCVSWLWVFSGGCWRLACGCCVLNDKWLQRVRNDEDRLFWKSSRWWIRSRSPFLSIMGALVGAEELQGLPPKGGLSARSSWLVAEHRQVLSVRRHAQKFGEVVRWLCFLLNGYWCDLVWKTWAYFWHLSLKKRIL